MALGDKQYSATANASGIATVTVSTNSRMRDWTVQQISIEMDSAPIGSTCSIRKNGALVTLMVPNGDAATGDPPILLRGQTDQITVTWTGVLPGSVGSVLVVYDDGV